MPVTNPNRATVKHTPLTNAKVSKGVSTLNAIVGSGTQSADVQSSPIAKQALSNLQTASNTLAASVATKVSLGNAFAAAIRAMGVNVVAAATALRTYESAVNTMAEGNAAIITAAGLLARDESTPKSALGLVTGVHQKLGKLSTEAILMWPKVPGATGYAIQVNMTPATPAGPWTSVASGSSRKRVLNGPGPASQFLARVAAVASNGTQTDWSTPILVVTR
jgi:hypothetical protein